MHLGYLIRIETNRDDITDNSSIGFVNGDFQLSTIEYSGYAQILDHSNIGTISNENSSLYGGTFSLHNDFSLSICNPVLINHINQHGIRFVGCALSAWLVRDGIASKIINAMKISDFAPVDEITIKLTAKDSVSIDGISTAKSRITGAMIPTIDKSKLDSSISATIGNPAWVKLIPCSTTESNVSVISGKGQGNDLEGNTRPLLGDGTPYYPTSFFCKAINRRLGYPTEILLGSPVMGDLPKSLIGMSLEVISGSGKGNYYGIADIYTKNGSETWVVLDKEIEENELISYGEDSRQTGNDKSFVRGFGWNPIMYSWAGTSSNITNSHPEILAISKTDADGIELINAECSRFRLANSNALFAVLIDTETSISSDCIGLDNGEHTKIDVKSVSEIVKESDYRLISLNYGNSIKQEQDNIKVNALQQAVARIDNKDMGSGRSCDAIYNPSRVDSRHFSKVIHAVDNDSINRFGWSDMVSATALPGIGTAHYSMMQGAFYYRVDTPIIDGRYIGDSSIDNVFPALNFKLSIDQPITSAFRFFVHCRISVVDDNGCVSDVINYSSTDDDNGEPVWVPPCEINLTDDSYTIQAGCDITGDGEQRIKTLISRLKSSLVLADKVKSFGKSAKYLYIQFVAQTSYQSMTIHQIGAKLSLKSPGLIYTISIPKDKIYIKTINDNNSSINNPVALLRALCDRYGVPYNAPSFATCETMLLDSMGLDGSDNPQIIVSGSDSIEDLIAKICRASNISVYSDGSKLYAKWWIADQIEDRSTEFVLDNTSILKDGYSISRDQGGYISTDYDINAVDQFGQSFGLSVIAGDIDTFPAKSQWTSTLGGDIADSISVPSYTNVNSSAGYIEIVTTSANKNLNASPWVIGYYYGLSATPKTSGTNLFGVYKCISTAGFSNLGQKIILQKITGDSIPELASISYNISAKIWRSMRDWQYLVSGSMVDSSDYVTSFNLWESCKAAKALLGKSNSLDQRYTKHDIAAYTSRKSWLKSMLYLIKHNTFARSIIRLSMPISDLPSNLNTYLLSYAQIGVGPYSASPTTGWIIGYSIEPSSDELSLTIMTAKSDESVLIYDENGLSNQTTINEYGYTADNISELIN